MKWNQVFGYLPCAVNLLSTLSFYSKKSCIRSTSQWGSKYKKTFKNNYLTLSESKKQQKLQKHENRWKQNINYSNYNLIIVTKQCPNPGEVSTRTGEILSVSLENSYNLISVIIMNSHKTVSYLELQCTSTSLL